MNRQSIEPREYMLVDIDTQKDLLIAEGNCCVRNHHRVLLHIRRIMAWARFKNILVISTCEVYPDNGIDQHRCIRGTNGQKKIRYTLLNHCFSFPLDTSTDIPVDLLCRYKQIILPKRCIVPFDEPRIDRFLSEARASKFILVGAIAERSVLLTALGLLQRGKKVIVVTDAIGKRSHKEARLALGVMHSKGAKLIKAEMLVGVSRSRQVGICHCDMCKNL